MTPVVILSSGGIKSTVAAAHCAADHELILLHVHFGQASSPRELAALDALAESLPSAEVVRLTLPHMGPSRSSAEAGVDLAALSRGIVGSAGYSGGPSPTALRGLMPVLCTMGAQTALQSGAQRVILGLTHVVRAGHLGLADFTAQHGDLREFLHAFNIMTETWLRERPSVELEAPLYDLDDAEVIKLAFRLGVPLQGTWTCDGAAAQPCGSCPPCRGRREAFNKSGYADPAQQPAVAGAR